MDILPFTTRSTVAEKGSSEEDAPEDVAVLKVDDEASWCLFSLEVRNMYGLPFEATFERIQEGMCILF